MVDATNRGQVAVLGAGGQLGRALLKLLGTRGTGFSRTEADLASPHKIIAVLDKLRPFALINAAAYTQVDKAETEKDVAEQVNGRAPGVLAAWAKANDIPFVHFSTDYVFSETANQQDASRAWLETGATRAINAYGQSKLQGEKLAAAAGGKFLVFRTSWVYDADGKNFLNTMLRLAKEKEEISVVKDQIGAPTFACDLAEATLRALGSAMRAPRYPSGIYHLTNGGETSWYGFATAIFEKARELGVELKVKDVRAIPSSAYPTPAARPLNSRLDNAKFKATFGFAMRPWQHALSACLAEKFANA